MLNLNLFGPFRGSFCSCIGGGLISVWVLPNICRDSVRQLAYVAYVHMPTFISVRAILDMCTFACMQTSPLWFVKVFKICLVLIVLSYFKTYCYIFDLYKLIIWRFSCRAEIWTRCTILWIMSSWVKNISTWVEI